VKTPKVEAIAADPAVSYWLKSALCSALDRDPVDAWADAARLAEALRERCDAILQSSGDEPEPGR
jgi:hypothetical protein